MSLDELVERLRSPMFDKAGELGHAAHEAADRLAAMREVLEEARPYVEHTGAFISKPGGRKKLLAKIDNALTGKEGVE